MFKSFTDYEYLHTDIDEFYITQIKSMKFLLLNILILFISIELSAQNNIQEAILNFASNPVFANASISFHAVNAKTGEILAEYNPSLSLPAASTTKLFSTASAFELLGPNYRPETKIYTDGIITSDSICNGNIWIRGGGDPSLGSKYFTNDGDEKLFLLNWADSIKKIGIKAITGNIIADASEFGYIGAPDGWAWSDMGNYYGAGASGLTIFDNMIKYYFRTGSIPGTLSELTHMSPKIDNFQFHNYIVASRASGDNSYIYGSPYSLDRFGTGTLPINNSNFLVKGSLPDPENQFAYEFYNALISKGIIINGSFQSVRKLDYRNIESRYNSNFKLLYSYKGESVLSIATLTNMKSINLFAEHLLCLSGYQVNNDGSLENSLTQIEKYWKTRMNFNGLYLKDGSGLSRSNAISAKHFSCLLVEMTKSNHFNDFLSTLPVAGVSGTLSSVCKNQPGEGRLKAKSGTINRIKSYSGYVESKSGQLIAFGFIVNNYNCSASQVVDLMERVFNVMALE